MRLTFAALEHEATQAGLILERETSKPNNGHNPYALHANSIGTTTHCKNLQEVKHEITNYLFEQSTRPGL